MEEDKNIKQSPKEIHNKEMTNIESSPSNEEP
jgi:hypothetical protein